MGKIEFPRADAKTEEYDAVFFTEHPDVGMVVPFNRTLRVGAIRALETEANFRPYEASARIFVVDDAHKMNDSSSNALLKTLEEPPQTSHIFLISSKPNSLLPTIRSRVQTLRFGPVEAADIEHLLLTTHKYSQDDARMIAWSSNGSVSRAVTADVEEFRDLRNDVIGVMRSAIKGGGLADILKRSEKVGAAKSTPEYEGFLDVLESFIHEVWYVRLTGPDPKVSSETHELAADADPGSLSAWLADIEQVRASLAVNINKKIATDALFLRMAAK